MIDSLSKHSTDALLKSQVIDKEDYDIYFYGMQIIFSTIIKISGLLMISYLLGIHIEMIIFIACFGIVRNYAGGAHSDSYFGCFVIMLLISAIPIYLILTLTITHTIGYLLVTSLLAIFIILKFAPVDTPNKPIYEEHRAQLKLRSRIASIFITLIILLTYILFDELVIYCSVASTALLVETLTLLPVFNRKTIKVKEGNK